MRSEELFALATRYARSGPDGCMSDSEQEYLDRLDREVREKAARLLDDAFEKFADDTCMKGDAPPQCQRFEDKEHCNGTWTGERVISLSPDGKTEVTRSWIKLEVPAEDYNFLAPEGFYVMKRALLGTHDVRYSRHGCGVWSQPARSAGLEVITGFYIVPEPTTLLEDCEDICDPFEEGPFVWEKLKYPCPPVDYSARVFDGEETVVTDNFVREPDLYLYDNDPHRQLTAIHASLGFFDDALY